MREGYSEYSGLPAAHVPSAPGGDCLDGGKLFAKRVERRRSDLLCILLLLVCSLPFIKCDSPPRITIQPNDLIAVEGESTELNCDAEGEPEPTIEWFHNGQPIKASSQSRTTMGGSIQFLDVRPAAGGKLASDAGVYYCLARNPLGQARSRNASLQVAYIRPEFRRAPAKGLVAAAGDQAAFECLPQAWPEPQIQWRHNGRPLSVASSDSGAEGRQRLLVERIAETQGNASAGSPLLDLFGSRLLIRRLEHQDAGSYSCLVETKGTHRLIELESPSGHLTVAVKPHFIEAPAQQQTVPVGGQVRLRCRMGGEPEPVISWRRQSGQPLPERAQIEPADKTLVLDQVSVQDQGVYVCEGENGVGSARSLATVLVIARPKFIVQPQDQEAELGQRIQLRCSGEASPQPMLFWYKEGHRQLMFPQQQQQQSRAKQSLDWPQAAALLSQTTSSDTSPSINKLFTLPPNLNDQLYLPSSSSSYSNNYFGNRIYVDNQGTLNIINATTSDNGYYACALISTVGSILAKAKVTIRQSSSSFMPTTSTLEESKSSSSSSIQGTSRFELLPPPVIKLGSSNQTLPLDTNALLVCQVVSQVSYKIQWFFESQPLQEEPGRVMVQDDGALSINNLKTTDSGIYTCVVTAANDQTMPTVAAPFEPLDSSMLTSAPPIQQSTSHSTMLRVANPMNPNIQFYRMDLYKYPAFPGTANLVSTNGQDAITIAWTAPSESGSLPVKEYIVEHYDTSQEHYGWRVIYRVKGKESLLIDGLSSDGSHFFVIRAVNGHGVGPSSMIAGPMRTIAGEAHYQAELQKRRSSSPSSKYNSYDPLSATTPTKFNTNFARDKLMMIATQLVTLTPSSSTSVRLQWSMQVTGNLSDSYLASDGPFSSSTVDVDQFLEGYSVRYRPIGFGEPLKTPEPLLTPPWNPWQHNNLDSLPSSLPLVTSYIQEEDDDAGLRGQVDEDVRVLTTQHGRRRKRDLINYFDYSQEFNEVRVADHNISHYTVTGLRPFTIYEFFVVPYYKDIDGVPSNILPSQTMEDRPSIAPLNPTIRPMNQTSLRLLWLHVPKLYANGIIKEYLIKINRSDVNNLQTRASVNSLLLDQPKVLVLPMDRLSKAPLTIGGGASQQQQMVIMYDLANLTYKSFYSIQIAASTSIGPGPWTDPQNFVMDPKVLLESMPPMVNDFDDVVSKSLISTNFQPFGNMNSSPSQSTSGLNMYMILLIVMLVVSVVLASTYLLYRRNNQKVITWKKTISEHFNNKFYMPSSVIDHHGHHHHHHGPNSIPQNIYDHQQHLIYSAGSTHLGAQSSLPGGTNGCVNSSGTGSLSSHGGLLPLSNDPNVRRINGGGNEQQILLLGKDQQDPRFGGGGKTYQPSQIINHGNDYYSVINNMSVYEELDTAQKQRQTSNQHQLQHQMMLNHERQNQTASSNSDTSCPSSVTRLLPNQNYNRDLLMQRQQEMILQQQVCGSDQSGGTGKLPFATMISGVPSGPDLGRHPHHHHHTMGNQQPLSPYATTNLMNQQKQIPQQLSHPVHMSLVDHSRQQNFMMHGGGGGLSVDDSTKSFINHQQQILGGGVQSPMTVFRTLQRNPAANIRVVGQQQQFMSSSSNGGQSPVCIQPEGARFQPEMNFHHATSIVANPLADLNSNNSNNLYEHIDYSIDANQVYVAGSKHQSVNEIISSSTSSGSMSKCLSSQPSHSSPEQTTHLFRRGSSQTSTTTATNLESHANPAEAHDLRVFSSQQQQSMSGNNGPPAMELLVDANQDDEEQADETTAFRKGSSESGSSRSRQMSKRKRQQQRNRLHNNNNNNQKLG